MIYRGRALRCRYFFFT